MTLALALMLVLQEKVALRHAPRQGDVATSVTTMEMKIDAKADDGTKTSVAVKKTRKAATEFVEVAGGTVARKTVDVIEDVDEQTRDGEFQRNEKDMNKRKFTVAYKDGRPTFEGADGIGEGDKKWLADGDRFYRLLPKAAVAVGDSWSVTGRELDAVAEAREGSTDGEVKMTFKAIREVDSRRCAVIAVKWDIASTESRTLRIWLVLEGEMVFWIERGTLLSLTSKGEIVVVTNSVESGRGPMAIHLTTTLKEK